MNTKTSKTVKKNREGNITAAFGADMLLQGQTCIPNLLLRFYKQIGITDEEMMVIIQILRLRGEAKDLFPSSAALARYLSADGTQVEVIVSSLIDKELLTVSQYYEESRDEILMGFDFEPLFEKLSEAWACAKVKEIERTRALLDKKPAIPPVSGSEGALLRSFEQEFGRPLSPMEIEQVQQWTGEMDVSLVQEALRRAVLMGKHNFKYIGGILLEWKKNNLRTLHEVGAYDQQFQKNKAGRPAREKTAENGPDESKKAMLKALYLR
ncbi:DnaD domain-containing protein [Desulfotomaculum copahuensis]|uniref:Primosomal protein DnaI n=1 Tax=Desulfotomaculum copahuensis TaxID=1838280 RepID=A0A1B7LC76_9FIRM|nr:DnaD domain protein [Desulfotomaculum copahuensis]OAT80274.1 primosomal protein DnaI [Desulfotomaculum copahuensis]